MRPPRASREICLAIGLASGLLTWAVVVGPAHAGDSGAADEFSYGLAEMLAGRYATGCPAIEASYKLDPRPGTLFTLAECENKRGRVATAVARYVDYLSAYARLTSEQQQKQGKREQTAQSQKAALEPQVPRLTLSLPPGAPAGVVV